MDVLKEECPSVGFTIGFIEEVQTQAKKIREWVPDGWAENGRALQAPPNQIKGDVGKDGNLDGLGTTYIIAKTGKVLDKSGDVPPPAAGQEDVEDELDADLIEDASESESQDEVDVAARADAKFAKYLQNVPPGVDVKDARAGWDRAQEIIAAAMASKAWTGTY